ncbi:preprotein translocase subunit SecG [Bifidobacterium mongoliense DSM 21395]|uniref:Protein-export membrane protein SecG n=3 Tax=Bifidobacterium mongoliense TaxID=518643 RepID=A0A087C0P6_9BIFI|nr:preprotein translocase subunit SecG [Bifidobacterium mongoliense DSM 21395]ROT87392.1 preprotein translocase subunit SecG [Bifidobacterium mongoliense]
MSAMVIVKLVLRVVIVIFSLLLTLLILMHKGKGGGLSDMFGGGLTQNAGTSGVAEKNLNRWTVIIAVLWVAVAIGLDLMSRFNLG